MNTLDAAADGWAVKADLAAAGGDGGVDEDQRVEEGRGDGVDSLPWRKALQEEVKEGPSEFGESVVYTTKGVLCEVPPPKEQCCSAVWAVVPQHKAGEPVDDLGMEGHKRAEK